MAEKSPEQITIDTLTKENATLKGQAEKATVERDNALAARDQAVADKEAALAENKTLTDDLAKAEELVAEQTEKLADAAAAKDDNAPVVLTYEKEQYRVLAKQVQVAPGKVLSAAELAKDKEAVAELIKKGSGLLQKIEKAK